VPVHTVIDLDRMVAIDSDVMAAARGSAMSMIWNSGYVVTVGTARVSLDMV
jgi:hypothetical protein